MNQVALFNVPQDEFTSDDHYTPQWIFEMLGLTFDLDPAAPPGGVPWIPVKKYYTQAEDGLSQEWHGLVWCNPPYSNVEPWVQKMKRHRSGIMLLPHVKAYWRRDVWEDADGIMELSMIDRVKFMKNGLQKEIMFPTFFAGWGDVSVQAMTKLGRVR